MAHLVDARGAACPQPVIRTRNALKEHDEVLTIVDNETSQHNVAKMAEKLGFSVQIETKEDGMYLHISKPAQQDAEAHVHPAAPTPAAPVAGPLVLVIPDERMGRGEPELGDILIRAFFHTLSEVSPMPDTIIFFNSGVKLVAEGSQVVDDLIALRDAGVEILACGTCLGFYALKESVKVGEISNMYTIAETMLRAGKVISL
ncbi:SirA-like protein [Candidatus Moduliflexus flocculans]|uniref:SirA-like protein n=1 Tax=Candidatus Moduliflexus flocculans TaxID=1499966 RepID=A0A0S6W5K7_9BACT|nr:SirA-like protein [Candidatus Moduliflexus flocculans]